MFSSSIMAMSFIFTLVRQNIEKFNKNKGIFNEPRLSLYCQKNVSYGKFLVDTEYKTFFPFQPTLPFKKQIAKWHQD